MVGSPNLSGHLRHSCVWQLGRGPWGGGLKKKIILWKLIKGGESAIFSSQNHDHDQFTESWSFVAKTRHQIGSLKKFLDPSPNLKPPFRTPELVQGNCRGGMFAAIP